MWMIVFFFIVALAISLWLFPYAIPVICMIFLLFNLAIAVLAIFKKYKQTENPRSKVTKEILLLMFIILLVIFLGGLAGLFANQYVGPRFGSVAGFISALAVSFSVGYLVKWGMSIAIRNLSR